jgi:hypothetical protein
MVADNMVVVQVFENIPGRKSVAWRLKEYTSGAYTSATICFRSLSVIRSKFNSLRAKNWESVSAKFATESQVSPDRRSSGEP